MAGMLELDPYHYSRMRMQPVHVNPTDQALLGPLEHREFAREAVGRHPLLAAPVAAGIPLWTLLKRAGLLKTRSPASWDEIFAGYEGMLGGLHDYAIRK